MKKEKENCMDLVWYATVSEPVPYCYYVHDMSYQGYYND